jgi:hypothetical protein
MNSLLSIFRQTSSSLSWRRRGIKGTVADAETSENIPGISPTRTFLYHYFSCTFISIFCRKRHCLFFLIYQRTPHSLYRPKHNSHPEMTCRPIYFFVLFIVKALLHSSQLTTYLPPQCQCSETELFVLSLSRIVSKRAIFQFLHFSILLPPSLLFHHLPSKMPPSPPSPPPPPPPSPPNGSKLFRTNAKVLVGPKMEGRGALPPPTTTPTTIRLPATYSIHTIH